MHTWKLTSMGLALGLCVSGCETGVEDVRQAEQNVQDARQEGRQEIAQAEAELDGSGRLVIRPSGTEPVIRVMAEADNEDQVKDVVERICAAVEKVAA